MESRSGLVRHGALASLLLTALALAPATAFAQAEVVVKTPPPPMPKYDQPPCTQADICPQDGYFWIPGYWAWDGDYYWVPAAWEFTPEIGDLWTPGYWAKTDAGYVFHEGHWGKSVGYYGGIDYGFGYTGHGFQGGRWEDGWAHYNTAVNHVNYQPNRAKYAYNTPVKDSGNRISFNGPGGVIASPTPEELAADRDRYVGWPLSQQQAQNAWYAHRDPLQHFANNHGHPPIVAQPIAQIAIHPQQLPPIERFEVHTGNAALDEKFKKEQDALAARQAAEIKRMVVAQDKDRLAINVERNAHTYLPLEMEKVLPDHRVDTQILYNKQRHEMWDLQQRELAEAAKSKK